MSEPPDKADMQEKKLGTQASDSEVTMFNASPTGVSKDTMSPINLATKQVMTVQDLDDDTSPLPQMSHADMVVKKGIHTEDKFFKS